MVVAVQFYLLDMEMPAAMHSTVFWATKPHYMEQFKTAAQEWEYFERQKAGLEAWCQVAEAKKKMAMAKKTLISCRCL